MKSFVEWSKINENKISQMNIDQIIAAGPSIMAHAAENILMWLNMGIQDREVLPHPLEARNLKREVDAFLENYPKIMSQKTYQDHPYPVGDRIAGDKRNIGPKETT